MRKMIVLLLMATLTVGAWAQPPQEQRGGPRFDPQKFQQMVEESLTKAACLTPDEAKAFFPLYNEMRAKQREMGKQIHQMKKEAKGDTYSATILKIEKLKVQMAELEESYYKRFLKTIPAEKVFKVMSAEDDFHRRMVQGQRGKHDGQWGKGKRPEGPRPQHER